MNLLLHTCCAPCSVYCIDSLRKEGIEPVSYWYNPNIHPYIEKIAKQYGIEFLYRDFRVGFREGQAKARELGLYMQKYCGCVFSEEDRYSKQIERDKKMEI